MLVPLMLAAGPVPARGVDLDAQTFVAQSFNNKPPAPQVMWLQAEQKAAAQQILGHAPTTLRVRYWRRADRSVWILDEIGKERPITVGIVIEANQIERLRILRYRESRGWEVRHDFFTRQFQGRHLSGDHQLDQGIDGISGATLSVRAVTRLSRLALYYNQSLPADAAH